jgi:signal transduction histidine kinase
MGEQLEMFDPQVGDLFVANCAKCLRQRVGLSSSSKWRSLLLNSFWNNQLLSYHSSGMLSGTYYAAKQGMKSVALMMNTGGYVMESSWLLDPTPTPPSQTALQPVPGSVLSVEQRGVHFWPLPGIILGIMVLLAVLLDVTSPSGRAALSAGVLMLSMLFAASCSFWMSQRALPGRERWAWRFIALAEATYVVADLIDYFFFLSKGLPHPGGAVALFLPFYVLLALGAMLLPALQTTGARLVRVVVDVCILVGALLGLSIVFLIAPRFDAGASVDYIFVALPTVDSITLLALMGLVARGVQGSYRPVFFWLAAGISCFVCADSAFNYLSLPGVHVYSPGLPLVDPFWIAGAFLLGLAPLSLLLPGIIPDPTLGWMNRFAQLLSRSPRLGVVAQCIILALPVVVLFGLLVFVNVEAQVSTYLALEILTFVAMLLVITRQVLTLRDLVDARGATARALQLEGLKDQFITSVNHELRTPIMTMQGYIELLSELHDQLEPDRRAEMLDRAREANISLVQLVCSILDVRRIDQEADDFVPQAVNICAAVQTALALIEPLESNPSERALLVQVPDDLVIWGEEVRLQQIILNLLANAIKYSEPGTTITVEAQGVIEKGGLVGSQGKRDSRRRQMVEITVRDEGLGIPPEQLPLLFRRFVRLPRDLASNVRGTGLGLYLCRIFAEVMGGRIWAESSGVPGAGSIFHLRLPVPPQVPEVERTNS